MKFPCLRMFLLLTGFWPLLFMQAQDKEKIRSYLKVIEAGKEDTNLVLACNELASELLGSDDNRAKQYAVKGLQLAQKLKRPYLSSWSFNVIGLAYDYMGKPDSALFHYHEAVKIKQGINDYDGLGAVYMNIGVLYYYQGNTANALLYYNKSMEQYRKTNNQKRIGGILNNMGVLYRQEKKYQEAIQTFEKAYQLKEEAKDTTGMANALGNLGVVFQHMGRYQKAEQYHLRSMHLDSLMKNTYNLVSSFISLAELHFYTRNYSLMRTNLDKAIAAGTSINAIHYLDDAYKVYTQHDSAVGDYRAAYQHLKEFNRYNDQVLKDDRLKQMDKLEAVFSTREKEQQIKLLNATSEIKELKIRERDKQLLTFIAISVLLVIMLAAFIIVYGKIRRQRKELQSKNTIISEALQEKDFLLKEIHHRVKNNLQVISSLLSVQARYIKDPKAREAINESKDRVNAISILHQEIYRNEVLRAISTKTYFENLATGIRNTFDPEGRVSLQVWADDLLLDVDQLIPLGLIVNEVLTNAFKYGCTSERPEIKLHVGRKENALLLSVSDNGTGFDKEAGAGADSLGMKLITMFTQKLKAQVRFINQPGTTFELLYPLKHAAYYSHPDR